MFTMCLSLECFECITYSSTPPYEINFVITPILQTRKLSSRESNRNTPVYIVMRWNSQHLFPSSLAAESISWIVKLSFLPPSNKFYNAKAFDFCMTDSEILIQYLFHGLWLIEFIMNSSELYMFTTACLRHMHNFHFWKFS